MTTNQTIDGVPRELLEQAVAREKVRPRLEGRNNTCVGCGNWMPHGHQEAHEHEDGCPEEIAAEQRHWTTQLRAMLDAPAVVPKPTGLSCGWNLTRRKDGFVVGHQSVAFPPDEKSIQKAEREGYVWVPFLVPAAKPQPQGEPVEIGYIEHSRDIEWDEAAVNNRLIWTMPPDQRHKIPQHYKVMLYAEQPAPVAVGPGLTWWAQGDANFYTLHKDGNWYAVIQMNGELWLADQEAFLNGICPQHGTVADGKARDV